MAESVYTIAEQHVFRNMRLVSYLMVQQCNGRFRMNGLRAVDGVKNDVCLNKWCSTVM